MPTIEIKNFACKIGARTTAQHNGDTGDVFWATVSMRRKTLQLSPESF